MKRLNLLCLVVNDDDLECKKETDLNRISISSVGFIASDLERFDMIIYKGRLGQKVLRLNGI